LPVHLTEEHTGTSIHGRAGLTFGRQIGAYPILIGVPYHIPLESSSNIMITGHGARSITGVEVGLDIDSVTEKQLEAIPGIGKKAAWNLISARAKLKRKETTASLEQIFETANMELSSTMLSVLGDE
jgi:radical SAM superfamily enzyme with C-terminal helix-hairpin-helix motif